MSKDISITVIGSGSYGTALAIALSRNNCKVLLWGRNKNNIQKMKISRCNSNFLPDLLFPSSLCLETSLAKAVSSCRDILIVVPSHAFRSVLLQIKSHLKPNARIAWATKGLEEKTGRLLQNVAQDILGNKIPLAVVSIAIFARELAMGLPTSITIASNEVSFSFFLKKLLNFGENCKINSSSDLVGIQISGAIKNIIAIGVGISDGNKLGSNARVALITYGLSEISRLGIAMGAEYSTFMSISGLGDLILTCTDNQSRNRRFGLLIGQGSTIKKAKKHIKHIVEGYQNLREVRVLANKYKVCMPITEQIYKIVYEEKKDIRKIILTLLNNIQEKNN